MRTKLLPTVRRAAFAAVCASFLLAAPARAGEAPQQFDVILSLVKADRIEEAVDAGATTPEMLPPGEQAAAAITWPKNVKLDDQPAFEIYYKGSLVGRKGTVKRALAPGKHTIWPGDHAFEVGPDGKITTADPEVVVDGNTVKIKCYPVTLAAYRVNSPESTMNVDMRLIGTGVLSIGVEVPAPPPQNPPASPPPAEAKPEAKPAPPVFVDLVPFYHSFKPLVIWLPATGGGKPYNVRPGKFELVVKPGGLEVPGADARALGDMMIRGHKLYVPFRGYPVVGRTIRSRACQAVIPSGGTFGVGGGVNAAEIETIQRGVLSYEEEVVLTYSGELHRFMAGNEVKPGERFIEVEGSLAQWPEKAFCYDNSHPANAEPRILVVERGASPLEIGRPGRIRVQWLDSSAGQTVAAPEVVCFFCPFRLDARPPKDWLRVAASPAEDHVFTVTPPADMKPGVYTFRVAVCEKDKPDQATPWSVEALVGVVDPAAGGALAIFTQKARDAFVCGEAFYLGLGVKTVKPIPARTAVELDVADPFGQTWPLARDATPREIASADALHFWLKGEMTSRLAPGRYTVTARLGPLTPAEFTFDLVCPDKTTSFATLLHGKYSSMEGWSGRLESTRDGTWTAEILAADLEDLGINRVVWSVMNSPIGRYYRQEPERRLEDFYRNCPTLPHWQSMYYPTARERLLNSFLRHGIDFALDIFPYEDDGQPSYLPHIIGSQRYTALQMQAMRHSPANLGLCAFNERYAQPGSNWPPGMLEIHMRALQQNFVSTFGYTMGDAGRAKERFLSRPAAQRDPEDVEKYRPAGEWGDYQYDEFVRRTVEAGNKVAQGFRNTTIFRSFAGINGYVTGCGYPPTMYKPLDWATTVLYKDGYGFGPAVLFGAQITDVLNCRDGLEVVPSLALWGSGTFPQPYTKQLFNALSQRVDGMGAFAYHYDFQNGGTRSDRDLLRNIFRDMLTPYGDWLKSLGRGYRQVAVCYSRSAQMLSSAKHITPDKQAEGIWIACIRAGFPADYLRDEQLLAGEGERYKVVFVPGFTQEKEMPPNIREALQSLARKGCVIIAEDSSKIDIDGVVRLNHGFDRYSLYSHSVFWFPNHWDADWILTEKLTRDLTELLRAELPKYVPPAAVSTLNISPDWLQRGETSVMVVPDFEYPQFTYEHIEQFHKPFVTQISFPRRGPVCYDVLENTEVPVKIDGETASIMADVRHYGGKLYAFLPAKIGGVSLRATKALAAGEPIGLEIEVLDDKGRAIQGSFPLRIEILAPDGKAVRTIYRAAAPKFSGEYVPGLNAPAGSWKARACELISGKTAEAVVTVGAPAPPPALKADDAAVWATDVPAVRALLATQKQIAIPLEAATQQWARPEAERLAQGLRAKGLKASVVDADALVRPVGNDILDAYHSWRAEAYPPPLKVELPDPETQKPESVPVIAIGKRWESRLIESLLDYSVLADVPSELHPGPGRALVQYVWNAFSVEDDLVCVSVSDAEGLRKAVDWLLSIPQGETGRTYKPKIEPPPAPKGELAAGAPAEDHKQSFRALYGREDEIQNMAIDPATGRIVVGTRGWGHNVFCLDASGKKLWSRYLPEHNVHRVSFSPDGKKVIAGVGMPATIYVLNETGEILFRFDASEYPQHRFRNTDEQNGFPYIINPVSGDIYAWGKTGVMCVGLDGTKRWFLDRWEAMQKLETEVVQEGSLGIEFARDIKDAAVSPDGKYFATAEEVKGATTEVERGGGPVKLPISSAEVVIFDAQTLKEVKRHVDTRLCIFSEVVSRLNWLPDSSTLIFTRDRDIWRITLSGEVVAEPSAAVIRPPLLLAVRDRAVRCEDRDGSPVWIRRGLPLTEWVPAPDYKRFYGLDTSGTLHCLDAANGADLWAVDTGRKGLLRLMPDGDVLAGGLNGSVTRFSPAGEQRWSVLLRTMHEVPGDYDAFVAEARHGIDDISTRLYPSMLDAEGDLDSVVRFGLDVVKNGSFEEDSAWELTKEGAGFAEGRTGKRGLQTSGGTATQAVAAPVIPNATYLLEFYYRPKAWDDALTAGVNVGGPREVLTGMQFTGEPGKWHFGRLAAKAFSDTTSLTVGFEAAKGTVDVDDARLRSVRFPSRNFLFNSAAHAIKPRFVDDLSTTQRGVPRSLETEMLRRDHVTWYVPGGGVGSRGEGLESMALLQNGQLDDVGKMWHTQPDPIAFNIGMMQARYVSHVVIYFSHQYPGEQWPRFQIKVNDVKTKNYVNVASVRGNRRHFCVVTFQPILTDLIYIIPVGGVTQWDATITEVEIYGPLGGPETVKGWPKDPEAMPMFMATPSHVRQPAKVDLVGGTVEVKAVGLGPYSQLQSMDNTGAGVAAADGRLYHCTAGGQLIAIGQDDKGNLRQLARGDTGSVALTGTPALYSARALVPSADGALYCLAAVDCAVQWKYQGRGRMLSAPLADGDDVYVGSDDGNVYKLDVESGMLLWQTQTGSRVRTSPALADGRIFVASWDGSLHCLGKDDGRELWKAPIAPYTISSPAAAAGRVYIGDEDGFGHCFDAASGKPAWKVKVGDRISATPAVTDRGVIFAAEDGTVLCAAPGDGAAAWKYQAPGSVKIAPLPTTSGLVVASAAAIDVLDPANGAKVKSFDVPGCFDIVPWNGFLYACSEWKLSIIGPKAPEKK